MDLGTQQPEQSPGPAAFGAPQQPAKGPRIDLSGTEFGAPEQPAGGPKIDLSGTEFKMPDQPAGDQGIDLGGMSLGSEPAPGEQEEEAGGRVFTIEPTSYDLGGGDETAGQEPLGAVSSEEQQGGPGIELTGYETGEQGFDLGAPDEQAAAEAEAPGLPLSRERGRAAFLAAAEPEATPAASAEMQDTVNPLVSGASAGVVAGIGCALPIVAVMVLGIGVLSQFLSGPSADQPIFYTSAMAVANITGLAIVVGMVLAILQSAVRVKMFSFLGVVISALFGGILGAAQGFAVSFGSDAMVSVPIIMVLAAKWSVQALLVGIAVVIIRRVMMSPRRESFSSRLSVVQVLGVVLSLSIVGAAVYGEVMSSSEMSTAKDGAVSALRQLASPEGLQVINQSGYIDPNRQGDLVITGVVQNTTGVEKAAWYLVADVYDARGSVLAKARMLNGMQMFSKRDLDILAKRGENVQDLKNKMTGAQGAGLAPQGMVNFEVRIVEPPAGITSFMATLQQIDLMQLFREVAEETK
jgi:hypothetical protein